MVIMPEVCRAAFALQTKVVWSQTTLRKGELISPDLLCRVSCTMDANFSSRKVWCKPVLKRKVSNGAWTTDFLVVEEVSLEESQSGVDQITAVVSKTVRRIGTGKVDRKARFLEFVKMAERWKAVLVRLAPFLLLQKDIPKRQLQRGLVTHRETCFSMLASLKTYSSHLD
jgi:hypothetical protein